MRYQSINLTLISTNEIRRNRWIIRYYEINMDSLKTVRFKLSTLNEMFRVGEYSNYPMFELTGEYCICNYL